MINMNNTKTNALHFFHFATLLGNLGTWLSYIDIPRCLISCIEKTEHILTHSLLICNPPWILKNLDSVCFSWGQHEITNSCEERNTIAGQIPTTPLHYPLIKISGCNLFSLGRTKAAPMLLSAIRLETTVERLETTVERHVTINLKDNKFFKSPTSTSKNCFQSLCLREKTKSWDGWYPDLHCVLQAKSHF